MLKDNGPFDFRNCLKSYQVTVSISTKTSLDTEKFFQDVNSQWKLTWFVVLSSYFSGKNKNHHWNGKDDEKKDLYHYFYVFWCIRINKLQVK